jgi:diacylglycerol kinase (ATP)
MDHQDMSKPVHLIVNPHSGHGGRRHALVDLRAAMRAAQVEMVEYTTKSAGDATRYAREIAEDARAVMVWGGDGTVNDVVNGMISSETPILPCRAGTENLLAKELRIPSDPRRIVETLLTSPTRYCDVGVVNGHNFMLIIGIGFDGEVVRRLSAVRTGHISYLSYFWPIWRTFWEHDFPKMRIIADGKEIFNDYGMAFVGNISRYAVGLRICRDAVFDDGLLDLVVFSCKKQTALVLHAAWTLLRRHPLKGDVIYKQFRNLQIECDRPVSCQVDGDVGPDTPLDVSMAKGKIKLIMPEPRPSPWAIWPWKGNGRHD